MLLRLLNRYLQGSRRSLRHDLRFWVIEIGTWILLRRVKMLGLWNLLRIIILSMLKRWKIWLLKLSYMWYWQWRAHWLLIIEFNMTLRGRIRHMWGPLRLSWRMSSILLYKMLILILLLWILLTLNLRAYMLLIEHWKCSLSLTLIWGAMSLRMTLIILCMATSRRIRFIVWVAMRVLSRILIIWMSHRRWG